MQPRHIQRFMLIGMIMMIIVLGIPITQAQSINQSIITFRNGDLWSINIQGSTATQLTQHAYNGGPILSPDGRRIAYLSTAQEVLDKVNRGESPDFAGSPPTNIWVMDVATQTFVRIADQTGAGEVGYLRSVPAWSPDSTKLVWSQLEPSLQGFEEATLQVYDFNSGLQATLVNGFNLGFQDGGIWMPEVFWGDAGIARILFTYTTESRSPFQFMEIYNPANGNLTRYDLGFQEALGNFVLDYVWVTHNGRNMIALRIQDYWEVFDPLNGSRSRLAAPPRLKAKFVTGGLELIPLTIPSTSGASVIQWQAIQGQAEFNIGLSTFDISTQSTPTISPDGSQIAWHNGEGVSTWSPSLGQTGRISEVQQELGQYFLVPAYRNVAWAPTEWITSNVIITPQPTPTTVPIASTCNLTPRLTVGQNAVVNPGPSNRVRVGATTSSAVIDSIDAGEVVYVERGPVCANGFNWFFIRNSRIAGWTAEGGDGAYWLSIDISNTFCFNSPPMRLSPGINAFVLPGVPNNIRSNVGTDGTEIIGVMPAGATFAVTGTSQCDVEGRRWFPIEYNGVVGWTAEGQGDEYWVAPIGG